MTQEIERRRASPNVVGPLALDLAPVDVDPVDLAPVGRTREVGLLRRAVEATAAASQFVAISGGPWVGKTHLLGGLAEEAARRGWTVASGRPVPRLAPMPFDIFVDALDHHVARAGDGERGPLFDVPERADRYRAFRSVRSLLERLADPGLLLALDDVHLADEWSMDLLDYLIRHPPDGVVLIALACRSGRTSGALTSLRPHSGATWHIELEPLTDDELNRLIPCGVGWTRRRLLCTASGGNPGVLRALLASRLVVTDGLDAYTDEDLHGGVPPVVPAVLQAELRAAPPSSCLVAQAAAVCGDPFAADLVATVARLSEAEVRDGLDDLLAEDIVRPAGTWREFRFRDPVTRAAAYHSAERAWLSGAHARAAGALAAAGGSWVRRACQIERTAVAGDDASARVLVSAARESLFRSPDRAGRWLRTSELVGGCEHPSDVVSLRGVALALVGRLADSRRLLGHECDLMARSGAPVGPTAVGVVEWCGRVNRLLGRYDDARRVLLDGVAAAASAGTDATGLHLELAALAHDCAADREWPWPELVSATGHADPALRAHAFGLMAVGHALTGRVADAEAAAGAGGDIADGLTDDEITRRPDALSWIGEAERRLGYDQSAVWHLGRGLHAGGRSAHGYVCTHLSVGLGDVWLRRGELKAAAACADHAADAARIAGSGPLRVAALTLRGQVLALVGETSSAVRVAERAVALATWYGERSAHRDRWAATAAEVLARLTAGAGSGPSPPAVEASTRGTATDDHRAAMLASLSGREGEIARLVSEGRTNQQIATALALSAKTVETYLGRIFKKLGVCSRAQIAHLVGLIGGGCAAG